MKNLFHIFILIPFLGFSQTGEHKDSERITGWATSATVVRGSQHVGTDSSTTTTGENTSVIGKADGDVVSLGDGGSAIITFREPIKNNIGNDFAVFENSFQNFDGGSFLELAFVEVSSDGINYVRFPATSNTKTKVSSFGSVHPDSIHNLAGKHLAGYGTPFDLEELKDSANLDVNNITHIKVIDVIGDSTYSSKDSRGNIIYDPFPTPFNAGGFDLDAVAVIDETLLGFEDSEIASFSIQNPVSSNLNIDLEEDATVSLLNCSGVSVLSSSYFKGSHQINVGQFSAGLYVLLIEMNGKYYHQKIVKL